MAGAIQAVDGMAWQVRMRIIEAYLAAITDKPKREFLPYRTPVTGKRDSRGNLNCSVSLRQWSTSPKETGADATGSTAKSGAKAAASANGSWTPRAGLQSWPDMMPTGWRRARAVPAETAERCEDDDEDPFGYGGALDEREEESAHEAGPSACHVNTLVLGGGVVHDIHETWLIRSITFCGKYGAWATTAPRLLTKECLKEPGRRAYELRRLISGKEPNRRTAWPRDTPLAPVRMYLGKETKGPEPENQ